MFIRFSISNPWVKQVIDPRFSRQSLQANIKRYISKLYRQNWGFLVELINVSREESGKLDYPAVVKSEGIPPSQYGTKGLVGDKLTEMEEKYDLSKGTEGFVVKGEGGVDEAPAETDTEEESEEGEEGTTDEII